MQTPKRLVIFKEIFIFIPLVDENNAAKHARLRNGGKAAMQ